MPAAHTSAPVRSEYPARSSLMLVATLALAQGAAPKVQIEEFFMAT
jgi:hypothetical protein